MYRARGVPDGPDDGTLAPLAVAASLPFAPELVVDTLRELVRAYPGLRSDYGLRTSLNPTFGDWISPLNYGLDLGPVVMMIENQRTGLPWNLMRRCPYIWRGLRQAGFARGWLESEREPHCPASVEGRWRERGTPFSKLSESATSGERADEHPTATMQAARIHSYGDPTGVKVVPAPRPEPGPGQVLVRVKAAGVNPLDWMVAEGKARSWLDHRLPLTLCWELAGIVEKLGADVGGLKPGDEVFGMIDLSGDGAAAEYAVGNEIRSRSSQAPRFPRRGGRPHRRADGVPGAVRRRGPARGADGAHPRGRGRSGVDGGAARKGARGSRDRHRVGRRAPRADPSLGCDEAIDYKATRFEDQVRDVDVVLDAVSADSQRRSLGVLKKGGILVALTDEPRQDLARTSGVRATMIGVKPDGRRLAEIAKLIDDGKLRPVVQAALPLAQVKEALAAKSQPTRRGEDRPDHLNAAEPERDRRSGNPCPGPRSGGRAIVQGAW
jgi:NADPH:quinone reductase-like Zn-dependent oxidoreductase